MTGDTRHPRLLQDLPRSLEEEQIDELLRTPSLRIERIVSTGHASAESSWYDQSEHEWVIVLSGRARLRYEDEDGEIELGPGDAAFIPAHRKHQVAWTSPDVPTVWLAVFWFDSTPTEVGGGEDAKRAATPPDALDRPV